MMSRYPKASPYSHFKITRLYWSVTTTAAVETEAASKAKLNHLRLSRESRGSFFSTPGGAL